MSKVKEINLDKAEKSNSFKFTSCIVLTYDNKILLQYRDKSAYTYPEYLSAFGGKLEKNETPEDGIIRELKEELGAIVNNSDLISLGAVTEEITNHEEIIFEYFWHDKNNTITGCYEHEPRYFSKIEEVLENRKIMDDVVWSLKKLKNLSLIS